MILNTGQSIDIPAFFPLWLANRIREGYVFVRNPYNPGLVTRYEINPAVVGFTKIVVISFIDLYEKVKRNFPGVREVSDRDKLFLGRGIIKIAADHGMLVKPCGEGDFLAPYGADCGGCMTIRDYERAIGKKLKVQNYKWMSSITG